MLQTNSTVFADIRMEGKGLEFPRTAEEAATLYSPLLEENRENLSDLHRERTIIYFQSIIHVYVTSILSCLAVNRTEGPILAGFTCAISYILHL